MSRATSSTVTWEGWKFETHIAVSHITLVSDSSVSS